jgi:hypothetical protein
MPSCAFVADRIPETVPSTEFHAASGQPLVSKLSIAPALALADMDCNVTVPKKFVATALSTVMAVIVAANGSLTICGDAMGLH